MEVCGWLALSIVRAEGWSQGTGLAFPDREQDGLSDACVFIPRQNLIHLVFGVKLELFEALLFYFVLGSDVRFRLDFLNLVFELRMLPGKRPELLVGFEQMRFQF